MSNNTIPSHIANYYGWQWQMGKRERTLTAVPDT